MLFKMAVAVVVAWAGWYLWVGPKRFRGGSVTGISSRDEAKPVERPIDGGRAYNQTLEQAQARLLLGVRDDASESEIRAAHRRLVAKTHPDHGGSTEATRRLNAARDLLLKR
jgi:hypothetical protein